MPADIKRQIADTLLQLLEKKSLEKITVKELVTICGISRQTFYYHFEDVLDVVDWWTRQGAQYLLEESMRTDDPRQALRIFVDYTTEHRKTLQHILASRWLEQMEMRLVQVFTTYLQDMLHRAHPNLAMSPADEEAFLTFYACGISGLLVEQDLRTDAEKETMVNQLYWLLFQNPWGHILHS